MVIGLSGVQFGRWKFDLFNHEYDYNLNWTTQSSVTINHNLNKICDIKASLF